MWRPRRQLARGALWRGDCRNSLQYNADISPPPSLSRWLQQLAADGDQQLQDREALCALLRGARGTSDKTVAIKNQCREWIARVFPAERRGEAEAAPSAAAAPGGLQAISRADKARAAQYCYEKVLHHVLLQAIARAAGGGAAAADTSIGGSAGRVDSPVVDPAEVSPRDRQRAVDEVLGHTDLQASTRWFPFRSGQTYEWQLRARALVLQLGIINACLETVNFCWLESSAHTFPYTTLVLGRQVQPRAR